MLGFFVTYSASSDDTFARFNCAGLIHIDVNCFIYFVSKMIQNKLLR